MNGLLGKRHWLVAALALAAIIIGSLIPLGGLVHAQLLGDFTNALHYPSGVVIALLLWQISPRTLRSALCLWVACVVLFGAIEYFQPRFGRTGNLPDWLRSSAGVSIGFLYAWVLQAEKPEFKRAVVTVGWALLLALASPLVQKAFVLREHQQQLPLISGFEKASELRLWEASENTTLERAAHGTLQTELGLSDQYFARVHLPATGYPGITYATLQQDWRGYRKFCFDSRADGPEQRLAVRLDDATTTGYRSSATTDVNNPAVWHIQCVELVDLRKVSGEPFDLSTVKAVTFLVDARQGAKQVHLDNIRLYR